MRRSTRRPFVVAVMALMSPFAATIACGTSPATPASRANPAPECDWAKQFEAMPLATSTSARAPDAVATAAPPAPTVSTAAPLTPHVETPDAPPSRASSLPPRAAAGECNGDADCAPTECCGPMRANACTAAPGAGRCSGIVCPGILLALRCACQAGRCVTTPRESSTLPINPR